MINKKIETVKRRKPIIADLETYDNECYELLKLSSDDEVIVMRNNDDYPLLDSDYENISSKWYEFQHDNHSNRVFTNINYIDNPIMIDYCKKGV